MADDWRIYAERLLRTTCNAPVRQYATREFGSEQVEDAVSVRLPYEIALKTLPFIRANIQDDTYGFIGTTNFEVIPTVEQLAGEQKLQDIAELVIIRGETQFDIVRWARTDGAHCNITTDYIVEKLQEYDRKYGVKIFHAESEVVEFYMNQLPKDLEAFADDINAFCYDPLNQIYDDSVEEMVNTIKRTKSVYLWWD